MGKKFIIFLRKIFKSNFFTYLNSINFFFKLSKQRHIFLIFDKSFKITQKFSTRQTGIYQDIKRMLNVKKCLMLIIKQSTTLK